MPAQRRIRLYNPVPTQLIDKVSGLSDQSDYQWRATALVISMAFAVLTNRSLPHRAIPGAYFFDPRIMRVTLPNSIYAQLVLETADNLKLFKAEFVNRRTKGWIPDPIGLIDLVESLQSMTFTTGDIIWLDQHGEKPPTVRRGNAISSRDKDGNNAKHKTPDNLVSDVPVDTEALSIGYHLLMQDIHINATTDTTRKDVLNLVYRHYEAKRSQLFDAYGDTQAQHHFTNWLLQSATQCLLLLCVALRNNNQIRHIYKEAASGRLYAQGTNLQQCRKVVRELALIGKKQLDFNNAQLQALRSSLPENRLPAIDEYLSNKQEIRTSLANETTLSRSQIKGMIISLIFGARLSSSGRDSLVDTAVGNFEGVEIFIRNKFVIQLNREIKSASRSLVAESPAKNGNLINCLGKAKTNTDSKPVSHLLQGKESRMLMDLVHYLHPENILLLIHDAVVLESEDFDTGIIGTEYGSQIEVETIQ